MDPELLSSIYEAGALPERWPDALQRIAGESGAAGGKLIFSTVTGLELISSPGIAEITREFDRHGWNHKNTRVSRLLAQASHPGFLTDSDLHTMEEIRTLPMYRKFLTPRRADAGAATIIQGADNDGLVVAIEAFADHEASRAAVPFLNTLRPHLARAAALSGQVAYGRVATLVEAFSTANVALALLDANGKVVGASERFAAAFDELLLDGSARLRLVDPEGDRRLASTLSTMKRRWTGASIAVRSRDGVGRAVLHLIPARRQARDLFNNVWGFAVLADPSNRMLPAADILGALFDLTPAEARVAREVAAGFRPMEIAHRLKVSTDTVRSQLKKVFLKTSTRHQSEVAALMARLS